MNKFLRYLIMILSPLLFLTGCTTAMYSSPSRIDSTQNRYEFTIETGGFSGASTADARAVQEIKKYMTKHGYTKYKIIHRTDEFVPSGFKYEVQFYK